MLYRIAKISQNKTPMLAAAPPPKSKQGVTCAEGAVPTCTSSPPMQMFSEGPWLPRHSQSFLPKTLPDPWLRRTAPLIPEHLVHRLLPQGNHCALCTLLMGSCATCGPTLVSFEPQAPMVCLATSPDLAHFLCPPVTTLSSGSVRKQE